MLKTNCDLCDADEVISYGNCYECFSPNALALCEGCNWAVNNTDYEAAAVCEDCR